MAANSPSFPQSLVAESGTCWRASFATTSAVAEPAPAQEAAPDAGGMIEI